MSANIAAQGANDAEVDLMEELYLMYEHRILTRHAAKEKLKRNLLSHNIEKRKSNIHGVGVFAMKDIPPCTAVAKYNGPPSSCTIDFTPAEISELPEEAQITIKSFILPNRNGTYSIPEPGLAFALGLSWYINSCQGTDKRANVEFGNRRDESGFTEIVTTRAIEKDEELLLPYSIENSRRCMTTIENAGSGQEFQNNLPEDVEQRCRVCQDDLPLDNRENVIDIGCKCANNKLMCRGCAVKWFQGRLKPLFDPHKPDDVPHDDIVNMFIPGISGECELCKHELSTEFCKLVLREAAASPNACKVIKTLNERLNVASGRIEPVALRLTRVPGYRSVAIRESVDSSCSEDRTQHGNRTQRGKLIRYNRVRDTRPQYSHLGKRTRRSSGRQRGTPRDVTDLHREDPPMWQPELTPGRFKNRKAQFFDLVKKKWVAGKVHEYVSANERNDNCDCGDAVCLCPKYSKGMYRYTIDGEDGDDYFSDDDVTVKINGWSGEKLWKRES